MDKSNSAVNTFTAYVDQLRNTECSQKEKIACFQHISECIMSPALVAHINYATHCSTATNVLLLFCEDLDSLVRMSAEENLNKIFRALEKTRVSRILLDLYGEIKRNGNQRSLRICLNLFSYYAPQIKEKHVKWYALRILPCLQTIAQRKETQLSETLCEFVKGFGIYLQQGLTDSEICKLFEVFMANIGVECAVKRRCSSQNCISLIENSRNKSLMAKHGLNKVIELLLSDQQAHSVLGALGFLRLLLPLIIRGFINDCPDDGDTAPTTATNNNKKSTSNSALTTAATAAATTTVTQITTKTVMSTITNECSRQIIEIYDYCLHLLSTSNTSNHSTINAALEVINAILQALDSTTTSTTSTTTTSSSNNNNNNNVIAKSLQQLLSNQQLQHNEYLRKRKSLKNQIFQLKNYEMTTTKTTKRTGTEVAASTTKTGTDTVAATTVESTISANVVKQRDQQQQQHIRNSARSISECVENDVDGAGDDVDACDEDEEDDFTTLSEINEPQQTFTLMTTTVDVDNLIDAIVPTNTNTNTSTNTNPTTNTADANEIQQSQQQQHVQPQNLLNVSSTGNTSTSFCSGDGTTNIGDDKSQLLSDIDNESFNSIDFEAEITIGGTAAMGGDGCIDDGSASIAGGSSSKSNSDTIGSFFNNLISNAATESVSKLFSKSSSSSSPAAVVKSTSTKTFTPHADKSDAISTTSTSIATDNLSLISAASSSKRFDSLDTVEEQQLESARAQHARTSSNVSSIVGAYDDTLSRTASITASTAVLADSNAKSSVADDSGDDADTANVEPDTAEVEYRRKPNVNPFLSENSPLKQTVPGFPQLTLKIGTIYEQSMIYYTARFVSASFLLAGQAKSLHSDTSIRVSIKSLSLIVLAQCVRLIPEVLQLPLEITEVELRLLELHDHQTQQSPQSQSSENATQNDEAKSASESGGSPSSMPHSDSSSSILGKDYEHLDARGDFVDFMQKPAFQTPLIVSDLPDESLQLEIKDDHFGKSTCDYFNLNDSLSKSADPVLVSAKPMTASTSTASQRPALPPRPGGLKQMLQPLSKSEIIDAKSSNKKTVIVTESSEDIPPPMLPPRPPKRTKSMRKSIVGSVAAQTATQQYQVEIQQQLAMESMANTSQQQNLADILLYYNHTDPILRGGVQQIVGNFIQATGAGLTLHLQLNLQHLLAILLKGLQDEIHTVVIQALNAFDKIFPHVVSKYLIGPSCHYQQQQQQGQQCKQTATTSKSAAASSAVKKCQDNAGFSQKHHHQQQQQYTNDAAVECLNTQACLKTATTTTVISCCCSAVVTTCPPTIFNDNDELIAALLNAFQLQSKCCSCCCCCYNDNENSTHTAATTASSPMRHAAATSRLTTTTTTTTTASGTFTISPKLLLNKLRLCHHNKYWLVQNKYAEVISNLNYAALRSYYGNVNNNNNTNIADDGVDNVNATSVTAAAIPTNVAPATIPIVDDVLVDDNADIVCSYETIFLNELLELLGDDDFRVREHAAECLCRFIIQNAMQQKQLSSTTSTATPTRIASTSTTLNKQTETPTTTPTSKSFTTTASSMETYQTNFDLLWDFFDYRIFSGMSPLLRNLFRANSSILPPLSYTLSTSSSSSSSSSSVSSAFSSSALSSSASGMSSATMAASTFGGTAARNDAVFGACAGGNNSYAATFAMQRQTAQEEKLLAKVLYRMTNKLMALNDKNLQFGIIYTLKLLLKYFNFVDYQRAWSEFNLLEICIKFSYYNYTTAVDLNCQNDLIDVTGKLIAGSILISSNITQHHHQQQLDQLLTHLMKIINIYYHLFTNQKPLLFAKAQKSDLFSNAKELAIVQSMGYFGNDYVYIKLYNILRSANDSYKITINQESGSLLISLLKTCLHTLGLCIELRTHSANYAPTTTTTTSSSTSPSAGTATTAMASGSLSFDAVFPSTSSSSSSSLSSGAPVSNTVLKLIEEILRYLTKLINYAPGECIACLRQLLKYLFGQNYGNRQQDYYATFIRPYFVAKTKGQRQQKQSNSIANRNNCSNDNEKDNNNKKLFSSSRIAMMQTINSSAAAAIAITTKLTTPTMTSSTSAGQHNEQRNLIVTTHANYSVGGRDDNGSDGGSESTSSVAQDYHLLGELFENGLNFHTWKWEREGDCAKYIKLFEPLVIFCLTLFMKANAKVQAPILELLSQLLDLNVTYSVLDSKNVIFDQIINNLDLIENGISRNAHLLIPPMMKFLIQLTHKSDRKLITIPKIISITNNLLANNTIRECSILALKSLAFELFFMSEHTGGIGGAASKARGEHQQRAPFQSPVTRSPTMSLSTPQQRKAAEMEAANAAAEAAEALLANKRELDTQKEVVLGMLEKFIDACECQQVLGLLLLRERSAQQLDIDAGESTSAVVVGDIDVANYVGAATAAVGGVDGGAGVAVTAGQTLQTTLLQDPSAVYAIVCRAICDGRLRVDDWWNFFMLDAFFRNNERNVLANSKEFLTLLQLFITKDVANFCDLSYATIILANVILKTEEIYLVNHIKLYLKNHPMVEEREKRQQQRQDTQQRSTPPWWVHDGPSTSSAAAAARARAATGNSSSSSGGSISEINYFAKVLCEKLEACFDCLLLQPLHHQHPNDSTGRQQQQQQRGYYYDVQYCSMAARFVRALHDVCCRSRHKDALQSVFRLALAESEFLDKYYYFLTLSSVMPTPTVGAAMMQPPLATAVDAENAADDNVDNVEADDAASLLQLEVFKLLSAMKLLDPLVLLQQIQTVGIKWNVQRTLLREICLQNCDVNNWKLQQVQQLFNATFLNLLIAEHTQFVCNLCEVNVEFCILWLKTLSQHVNVLNKHSIRTLLHLMLLRICANTHHQHGSSSSNCRSTLKCLQLLDKLHKLHSTNRPLQLQLERLAQRLHATLSVAEKKTIWNGKKELDNDDNGPMLSMLLYINDLENSSNALAAAAVQMTLEQRIIDEKWLFAQLIKFSTLCGYDPQQLTRILLEIQSENKLHKIFTSVTFDVANVLRHAIASSLQAMLATFRNKCIQHNPHIHYMQPNPLARVSCNVLMTRIGEIVDKQEQQKQQQGDAAATVVNAPDADNVMALTSESLYLCSALIALIESIKQIEATALIYIDAKFIDKFVREHLLRPEHIATLLSFLQWCAERAKKLLLNVQSKQQQQQQRQLQVYAQQLSNISILLHCIEALLQQKFIWHELNQIEKVMHSNQGGSGNIAAGSSNNNILTLPQRNMLLCSVLDVLVSAATLSIQNTIFYKRYKMQNDNNNAATMPATTMLSSALDKGRTKEKQESKDAAGNTVDDAPAALASSMLLLHAYAPKAIFIAKLIETKIDIDVARSGMLSSAYITGSDASGGGGGGGFASASSVTNSAVIGDFDGMNLDLNAYVPMHLLESIGIAILRTNQFYAYAVTPFEIIQQQRREQQAIVASTLIGYESPLKRAAASAAAAAGPPTSGKLPTIPVESLSDVDVLRNFVKRLSIFGFTTRQQFEEYFMTFLLLINKVYDENMVDQQEQFQIKSTCLEAILELLITYKTFPIVGNKLSHFHHTTRWSRINCDSISLKKLHKVQLFVSESNIFYHPNLERSLGTSIETAIDQQHLVINDNIIGTRKFLTNQYDLNFIWQQMETYAQLITNSSAGGGGDGMGGDNIIEDVPNDNNSSEIIATTATSASQLSEDTVTRNYRYFTAQSGVDFKSSTQLIFDVLMQIIEHNHILVLPNLVKFCEICESRDQIKWIKDKALKLQETIPMDDTISHQHLIYLLCKTQAMLIPTFGELQQLCSLIGNYLKSSHIFIRNATLAGLLCLLECCSKTNTTIGKLSEELALLRDLIVGYINRHGIIDESSMQCSDIHTKLVWTLNYCLIEWTSKFVPQCHLLSNTIIAANNFLRKTNNLNVYLCVLHGLERMVVINNSGNAGNSSSSSNVAGVAGAVVTAGTAGGGVGIVTPVLHNKIEKLALDLVKLENEKFSIPALKLLLSCMYMGSAKQLENTELSNGIVQDDPEIIAQQTDKVDILLHCIKSSTRDAAWIYGQVLCQIIRDLVPPNEILTKVIKEFLAINQPHCDVIAMIVYQVFRCAIDSSFLQMLQDWLICSLPTFLALPEQKGVWSLSVIFLSASINLHLIKLFPVLLNGVGGGGLSAFATATGGGIGILASTKSSEKRNSTDGAGGGAVGEFHKLGQHEIALFVTAAQDFHAKLSVEQKMRFRDAFEKFQHKNQIYAKMLQSL